MFKCRFLVQAKELTQLFITIFTIVYGVPIKLEELTVTTITEESVTLVVSFSQILHDIHVFSSNSDRSAKSFFFKIQGLRVPSITSVLSFNPLSSVVKGFNQVEIVVAMELNF